MQATGRGYRIRKAAAEQTLCACLFKKKRQNGTDLPMYYSVVNRQSNMKTPEGWLHPVAERSSSITQSSVDTLINYQSHVAHQQSRIV